MSNEKIDREKGGGGQGGNIKIFQLFSMSLRFCFHLMLLKILCITFPHLHVALRC